MSVKGYKGFTTQVATWKNLTCGPRENTNLDSDSFSHLENAEGGNMLRPTNKVRRQNTIS